MSITVISNSFGKRFAFIEISNEAFIPYEAKIATSALIKKTIQQLCQNFLLSNSNKFSTLLFFLIKSKEDLKPFFISMNEGGGLIILISKIYFYKVFINFL